MSHRGSSNSAPPKGYVPGLGRGAAGFTTRSDIGPMASTSSSQLDPITSSSSTGTGSRAAELREAKLRMRQQQQNQQNQQQQQQQLLFGVAPKGYIPGAGRGAGMKSMDEEGDKQGGPTGAPERREYNNEDPLYVPDSGPYEDDDEEADLIYQAVDDRMNARNKKRDASGAFSPLASTSATTTSKIGEQFRELKEKLKDVTEEEWDAIPDVGDYSLRYKQRRREDVFTPLPDSILEAKSSVNADATSGTKTLATTTVTDNSGFRSVVSNMSGLAEARGTVLGMSLDKMSDSMTGQTVVDPKGYLTSLSNVKIASNAEVSDISKARLLLKSVRDTNPKHGPAWIASARVEEAADKINAARKLIQEGCETCPTSEDVWLEAARLHPPPKAKTILASAVRYIPHSVKIFLRAADLETNIDAKKAVLRKALECIPTSVTLWKAAIELEDANDAKILLNVAVEKVPHSIDMWLALAKLETYDNARKVLNRARKELPAEKSIWIAAAKLEESHNAKRESVYSIIEKAIRSLSKHDAVVSRDQWLKEAETAELVANSPLTSAAIVQHVVGLGVDTEDRQRTWSSDASSALSRGAVGTARAILAHALAAFPTKKTLWVQAVELEQKHGTNESLDEVLAAASQRLPRAEFFWLVRAKEKWTLGDIDKAREILTQAFAANPDSESVWLAAAKLEWETGEIERARVLLQRARERAPSDRVFMKSALLERECKRYDDALKLIEEGISKYPNFPKLYMMGGQISSEDLNANEAGIECARKYYQRGLTDCPSSVVLWKLASALEERASSIKKTNGNKSTSASSSAGFIKARSLLELSRLKNPRNPYLWVEAIRLERRAGNDKLATTLMARALQECPNSGLLLSEAIVTAPRVEQKSKSADAIKRCPDDPLVISAVASLFASERKHEKARKWFERAVLLDPDIGDSWSKYYAFELENGMTDQQQKVKERCAAADPKHGELWCRIAKDMVNRRKTVDGKLELVVKQIMAQKLCN